MLILNKTVSCDFQMPYVSAISVQSGQRIVFRENRRIFSSVYFNKSSLKNCLHAGAGRYVKQRLKSRRIKSKRNFFSLRCFYLRKFVSSNRRWDKSKQNGRSLLKRDYKQREGEIGIIKKEKKNYFLLWNKIKMLYILYLFCLSFHWFS